MRQIGFWLWLVVVLGTSQAPAQPRPDWQRRTEQQEAGAPKLDVIDRLRAQLAQPGPEGQSEREVAIERLLSLVDERAHAVLRDRLQNSDDPDAVRLAIVDALARRLLNPVDEVFGQRDETTALRDRLVRAYGACLAGYWQGDVDADGLLLPDLLREHARICLVRMPPRSLEDGLRQVAAAADVPVALRVAALRAAGDTQNLQFGRLLADFIAAEEPVLQHAARVALRYLTFAEQTFERKEQFDTWFQRNGGRRYLEVAEEAARLGARRTRQQREELLRVKQQAASEFVRAMTERRTGVDWAAVQARTLVDEVGTLRACLQQLQKTLVDATFGDDQTPRHAFARALLQRYRSGGSDPVVLRALLLEVASYLCRANEAELAAEVSAELLQQLGGGEAELQLSALRGLRRFPSPDARATVVRIAQAAVDGGAAGDPILSQALQTLSAGGDPGWRAPAENAPDRAAWVELVRSVCAGSLPRERRTEGLAVAMLQDRDSKRVPEIFDLLLTIANDAAREPEYRKNCLIHLQGWREQAGRSDLLVSAYAQLLGDPERDVRQFVADALQRLPDGTEEQKKAWVGRIIAALRERLPAETNMSVLHAMLDCLVAASRGQAQPGAAIGALNVVLDAVPVPVPQEQQARTDELLRALTAIAAAPLADQGQWIGACEMLLRHERRLMLRLVLENHNAVALAKDVGNTDATLAQRARAAMRFVLLTALLKPAKESWQSGDANRREAKDVCLAFEALPPSERLPENLQEPRFLLLRIDTLVACGRNQEAIKLGTACLDNREQKDTLALSPAQADLVRLLVADAHLQEGRVDAAAAMLTQIDATRASEARAVELTARIGVALVSTDARKAIDWLDRAVRGTAEDDPAFRSRLIAFWQARIKANPADRDTVLAEAEKRTALFDSPDCPEDVKEALAALRGNGNK